MGSRWGGGAWRAGMLGLAALAGLALWGGPAGLPARAYTPEQVEIGAAVFATSCASCHGDRGQGGGPDAPEAPALIEPRALTGFRHVQELYEFVYDSMPQDVPSSLPTDQYWAVVAWLLSQNGIAGPGVTLGPANAAGVSTRR
jgi:mono/diheme cytochrome c family protein